MASADPLAVATFVVADVEELDLGDARAALDEHGVIRVRGLFDAGEIRSALRRIADGFDPAADCKHDPADSEAIRGNLQKLQVGCAYGGSTLRALPRFLRMLLNPIFADDVYDMRRHFVTLARLRNRLYGLAPDVAVHGTDDGLWTASRLHQYPRGGGFMAPHRDALSQLVVAELGAPFAQPFLVMSQRGVDFSSGGAFVEVGGEALFYEDGCRPGDVVVYDGRTLHGVADIDPLEPLDLQSFTGRVVAFASLYRHLAPGAEVASFSRRALDRYRPDPDA